MRRRGRTRAHGQKIADGRQGPFNPIASHVAVRDHANGVFICRAAEDFAFGKVSGDFRRRASGSANIEYHYIGDDFFRIQRDPFYARESVCQKLRVFVIDVQLLGDSSNAMSPAAARTPAWRIPPPNNLRAMCAF